MRGDELRCWWRTFSFRLCILSKARGASVAFSLLLYICLFKKQVLPFLSVEPCSSHKTQLVSFLLKFFPDSAAKLIVSASVVAMATLDYNDLFVHLQTLRLLGRVPRGVTGWWWVSVNSNSLIRKPKNRCEFLKLHYLILRQIFLTWS